MLDRRLLLPALALGVLAWAAPAGASFQAGGQASTPAKPQIDAACDASCGDGSVESCRCLFQPTFEGACKDADAIFVGEVTGAEHAGGDRWRYTLRITCAWKGELGTAVAESGAHGCPALLEKGKSYLVYASWHGDRKIFEIGSCTRTAGLDHAAEDLKRLGEPHRKAAGAPR
jgi:hypothetical protein